MSDEQPIDALSRAIDALGGPSAAGRAVGVSPQAIAQWKRAPAERVLELERLTGVSRHALRPDVFGPEPAEAAA